MLHQTLTSCSLTLDFQSSFLSESGGDFRNTSKLCRVFISSKTAPSVCRGEGSPVRNMWIVKTSNKGRIFHVCLVCHRAGHACTSKPWRTGKCYFPAMGCCRTQFLMVVRYLSERNKELSDFPGNHLVYLFLNCQVMRMTTIFKENPLLGTEKGDGFQRLAQPQISPWSCRELVQGAAMPSSPAGRQLCVPSAGVVENPTALGWPKERITAEPLEISGVVSFLVTLAARSSPSCVLWQRQRINTLGWEWYKRCP